MSHRRQQICPSSTLSVTQSMPTLVRQPIDVIIIVCSRFSKLSGLFAVIHRLVWRRGDDLTTNHKHMDRVHKALECLLDIDAYIHMSLTQPKALPKGGEIV